MLFLSFIKDAHSRKLPEILHADTMELIQQHGMIGSHSATVLGEERI